MNFYGKDAKEQRRGILVTKEIISDKNFLEVTLFPMWKKKKNHHRRNTGKEENRSFHSLCFRYDFIPKNGCTECKKITNKKMASINYFKSDTRKS